MMSWRYFPKSKCKFCGKDNPTYAQRKRLVCSIQCRNIYNTRNAAKNPERNKKIAEANRGKKSEMWKGDSVGRSALHAWIKRNSVKPEKCQKCNLVSPYDLANKSLKYNKKTYTRDFRNWEWLCRKCHMVKDGRLIRLHLGNRKSRRDTPIIR